MTHEEMMQRTMKMRNNTICLKCKKYNVNCLGMANYFTGCIYFKK